MSVFGSGIRPWKRQTETKRAEDSSVPGKGELVVSDAGKVYAGDGATQAKDLSPMLRKTDADATYPAKPTGTPTGSKYLRDDNSWQSVPSGGATTVDGLTDATTVGKAVVKATDAATARAAIGAGTSSLTLGSTASTAAAGNDARLSDTRTPTDGSVTTAKVANGAIVRAKLGSDVGRSLPKNASYYTP